MIDSLSQIIGRKKRHKTIYSNTFFYFYLRKLSRNWGKLLDQKSRITIWIAEIDLSAEGYYYNADPSEISYTHLPV